MSEIIFKRFLQKGKRTFALPSLVERGWGRVLCLLLLLCSVSFQSEKINEQTAKALFVYNFTKHIEWPVEKHSPKFIIGIYGHSDILNELLSICYNKKVNERDIFVNLINSPEEISECSVLYLPNNYSSEIKNIIAKSKNQGVLIVTESVGLCTKGAGINIIKKNNRLVFELNEAAIQQAGLKVSAQLAALAVMVK